MMVLKTKGHKGCQRFCLKIIPNHELLIPVHDLPNNSRLRIEKSPTIAHSLLDEVESNVG